MKLFINHLLCFLFIFFVLVYLICESFHYTFLFFLWIWYFTIIYYIILGGILLVIRIFLCKFTNKSSFWTLFFLLLSWRLLLVFILFLFNLNFLYYFHQIFLCYILCYWRYYLCLIALFYFGWVCLLKFLWSIVFLFRFFFWKKLCHLLFRLGYSFFFFLFRFRFLDLTQMICSNLFLVLDHFGQWSISFILILIIRLSLNNLSWLFHRL